LEPSPKPIWHGWPHQLALKSAGATRLPHLANYAFNIVEIPLRDSILEECATIFRVNPEAGNMLL